MNNDVTMSSEVVVLADESAPIPKRKAGRPKGSKKGVSVRAVKGQVRVARSTTLELTHKLLAGSGDRIVETIIAKALDPKDKDQAAMLKLCLERIAPVAAFEKANAGQAHKVEVVVTLAAEAAQATVVTAAQASDPDVIDVVPVEVAVKDDANSGITCSRDDANKTDEEEDLPTPEGKSDELPGS